MNRFTVREAEFIGFLLTAPLDQCLCILKRLNKSQVNAICEIAHNVLFNQEGIDS